MIPMKELIRQIKCKQVYLNPTTEDDRTLAGITGRGSNSQYGEPSQSHSLKALGFVQKLLLENSQCLSLIIFLVDCPPFILEGQSRN